MSAAIEDTVTHLRLGLELLFTLDSSAEAAEKVVAATSLPGTQHPAVARGLVLRRARRWRALAGRHGRRLERE